MSNYSKVRLSIRCGSSRKIKVETFIFREWEKLVLELVKSEGGLLHERPKAHPPDQPCDCRIFSCRAAAVIQQMRHTRTHHDINCINKSERK